MRAVVDASVTPREVLVYYNEDYLSIDREGEPLVQGNLHFKVVAAEDAFDVDWEIERSAAKGHTFLRVTMAKKKHCLDRGGNVSPPCRTVSRDVGRPADWSVHTGRDSLR